MSVGPSPLVNPFQPCWRHVLRAQSSMPAYLRLEGSTASVCSLDLITSTG